MREAALLGNAGGGKSARGAKLSARTGIPLYPVDLLQWKPCGVPVADAEFERIHDEIVARDSRVIDEFGTYPAYLRRLEAAANIILIDHAPWRHYRWTPRRKEFFTSARRARSNRFAGSIPRAETVRARGCLSYETFAFAPT